MDANLPRLELGSRRLLLDCNQVLTSLTLTELSERGRPGAVLS
jgi:hypothetical protein